ncbi:hypothetical protein LZ32DRAFT_169339 [Colletotrichum eremochloae]|nr:hypothetical protein LZ32DRAFT_169339 [Colletotrichum eremochloae]
MLVCSYLPMYVSSDGRYWSSAGRILGLHCLLTLVGDGGLWNEDRFTCRISNRPIPFWALLLIFFLSRCAFYSHLSVTHSAHFLGGREGGEQGGRDQLLPSGYVIDVPHEAHTFIILTYIVRQSFPNTTYKYHLTHNSNVPRYLA